MKNKIVLITGSTDGIGQQCAVEFARRGATVLLHGRNPSRGNAVLQNIRRISGHYRHDLFIADFASLNQVRKMAADIQQRYNRLDILVNNAGVYIAERQLSGEGYEMTFAVNHLAPFSLTNLLLDLLRKSTPSKIINISSVAHQNAHLDFDNLHGEKQYDPYGAYALSKLANLLFTYELANLLEGSGMTAIALHPGVVATKLLRAGFGSLEADTAEEAAKRILYVASSDGDHTSGKYFVNDREKSSSSQSRDVKLQKEFWSLSQRLTGIGP